MGIYNGAGQLRAHYEYDAWGNVLPVTDQNGNAITSSTHIGNLNPFRYRGYYLDTETGLYYLMSRYYDPVTHRFVNADGYFQSGGDVLDSNMSAYCRNNPINHADPTGCAPKTLRQLQEDLLSSDKKLNYSIKDISRQLKNNYSYDDKFTVSSNGELKYYGLGNKVVDTVGAVICSVEADVDLGVGIGGSTSVGIMEFSALAKWAPLSFHYDEQNIFLGMKAATEAGVSVKGLDSIGWDYSNNYNYLSGQNEEHSGESHNIGFSAGAYLGIGGSVGVSWNLDYIANRWVEIWS